MLKRRHKFARLLPILLLMLPFAGILFFERRAAPVILAEAEAQAHSKAVEIINECLAQSAADSCTYDELLHIERDSEGKILLIIPNAAAINSRLAELSLCIDSKLKELQQQTLELPLGIVTGSRLISNLGPKVQVELRNVGALHIRLQDDFSSVGINQSRHRIAAAISIKMQLAVPFHAQSFEAEAEGVLCESIIIGPVPQTYLQLSPNALLQAS